MYCIIYTWIFLIQMLFMSRWSLLANGTRFTNAIFINSFINLFDISLESAIYYRVSITQGMHPNYYRMRHISKNYGKKK